jgi:hypothetical protein
MNLEEIKSDIAGKITIVGDKLKGSLSFMKDVKEASEEKISALVNDILGLAPIIELTGFSMKDVGMDIGIPFGISLTFVKERDVEPAEIEKLLEENKDKEILGLIVRALLKADTMQKAMNLSNYKFGGLTMKISFPPDVSLKFTRI